MRHRIVAVVLTAVAGASCATGAGQPGPRVVPPGAGAPAESARVPEAPPGTSKYADADVKFMQGMIGHHAQALEMTALLPSRTAHEEMKLLARRIEVSQTDEIKMMQRWLEVRGQDAPDPRAHQMAGMEGMDHGDHVMMPGMLTADEMKRFMVAFKEIVPAMQKASSQIISSRPASATKRDVRTRAFPRLCA